MQYYNHMVHRSFWLERIQSAWQEKSVVWLSGVRRVGKTVLCRSVPDVEYFDCELPRTRRQMEDPEAFLHGLRAQQVVLDEIHRLRDPSELLKIAADHYPTTRILATGSSTLGAASKFRDTLTGRKRDIWLTPMLTRDLADFENEDLEHRLLRGGLPPFFLAHEFPERDFQDWIDAYWAKDIQELFRLERRAAFQRFLELLLANSGGMFEATTYAQPCEVSRTTIANYLTVLEATHVAYVIRPFSTHRATEIVSAPKVYGFDTGFVAYFRGWDSLRRDDLGVLWEHLVLNEIQGTLQTTDVRYWRDKRGHEIDFVWVERQAAPVAIECQWSADSYKPKSLLSFRHQYPEGTNFVVAQDIDRSYTRRFGDIAVEFVSLAELLIRMQ
jgi:predicted AAA+ superfamily ATPase